MFINNNIVPRPFQDKWFFIGWQTFWSKILYEKNFPWDFQTRQEELFSELVKVSRCPARKPCMLKRMAYFKYCIMSKFNTIKLMFWSYDVYNFTVTKCTYPFFSHQALVILRDLPIVLLITVCLSNFACFQSSKAHALAVSEHYIICGCADGIIR